MKIDRVTADPHPAAIPANSERIVKDDKGTDTSDAVTFEKERHERESLFSKKESDEEKENKEESASSDPRKRSPEGKRLIDVVV
ncbi:MAG: hypothetical protein J5J00_14140 [Deltaproteobacteria bacterium]|nr:hypothetical protein [Deltaproteobacteria bacterium]